MLREFLSQLGNVTGKTYSPEEFGAIVKEALEAEKNSPKTSEKKDENKNSKK